MIINPQTLRGIYMGFNTLFNKAFEGVTPMYTEVAMVTPSTTAAETYAARAIAIDDNGALLVEREGGRRAALQHGEVSIRPTKTE